MDGSIVHPVCVRRESNPHSRLRRPVPYPLGYGHGVPGAGPGLYCRVFVSDSCGDKALSDGGH